MKSEGSWSMFVIAILCVIVIVIVLLGRRDVKAGGSKIQQRFPLSIAESVYDREGFYEDRCAFYSDYDAIRSIKVTVQGEWESGRIYLTLVDDAGKEFGSWSYSSPQEISEQITCNKPDKGLNLRFRVEKGAVGHWTVTFEEKVFAYKKWLK